MQGNGPKSIYLGSFKGLHMTPAE